jgi:hypothetical protein
VIALGAVLAVVASAINAVLRDSSAGGWFMYAPNSNGLLTGESTGHGVVLREAAVWLGAICVWLAAGWRVYRNRDE